MTVWLRHTNLYTCSPFWSFEQAQVDAYKKDTGKTPAIKVDHKTGQIVIRLGKGESALSFRLKYL